MLEEIEETTIEEANVDFFEFLQLNKKITSIKLSEDVFDEKSIPSYSSLLVVSNLYGYFVAGTSKGFIYASTENLRKAFKEASNEPFNQGIHIDILEGRVHFLRLTSDQLTIVVGIEGGRALCYDVSKFSTKSSEIQPYQIMKFSDDIMDIRPNPGERKNVIAFLLVSGVVYIKDFISNVDIGSIQTPKIGDQVTAICWSPKGKQLVCGSQSGKLVQFTPEGNEKDVRLAPPEIQQPAHCVRNVLWLENTIFIVTYYPIVEDENSEYIEYVISENKPKTVYSKVPDICFPSNCEKTPYLFMESIKDWGSDLKNIVICACTNSSETNIIGRDESNEWSSWSLSETARAILPVSDNETVPIGMALDLSSTDIWFTKLTGDEDSKIPPVPILLIYNNESEVIAYRCFQKNACQNGTNYPGMTVATSFPATGPSDTITANPKDAISTGPKVPINTGPKVPINIPKVPINAGPKTGQTAAVITTSPNITTNIPKNNFPPLGRSNLMNNIAIATMGSNSHNAPSRVKQASPTELDIDGERSPHEVRLIATEKGILEIQLLIDDIEKNYIAKYKERTKTDSLENPDEWSIGDFPIIVLETKRLEKEIKNIIEYLSNLNQETTDLNRNFVKEDAMAKQEIGLLASAQEVTPRRGTIQSRITEKYKKAFQNVKENAEALEKQLNMLYEQIKDHKANKFTGQPPLEYIDRSIQNISKGLYSNASQIEQLNTQIDSITEQLSSMNFNERSNDFVSQQIEHETRKSIIPVKFSAEAEEKTNQIIKKEWKLFKFSNINKSKRKIPYGTNLFSDIEPVQSRASPKIISPRKKSPIKTRGSAQIGIDKLKDSIERNKHGSPLRNSFSFDEESDYYNELDTPIKKNTYTDFSLPISEDTNEYSQNYNKKISELREMRLRYFEKKGDDDDDDDVSDDVSDDINYDVNDNVYVGNNLTYERISLKETRVKFQEQSEDDDDEITEEQKFENIIDSDRFSRINLTNDEDRIARLQIDPFEDNFYEPPKFSNINNNIGNISDYFISSPESPKTEEGVSYSLSSEQKDTITSEQSSTTQDLSEDSLDAKLSKFIAAAEISSISKVSEPQYYESSEILSSAEFEKKEEPITSLEEKFQVAEPGEISTESKVGEGKVVTNEEDDLNKFATSLSATSLGSFSSREPSSFGQTTPTPSSFIPNTFSISGNNVPPAFATPPPTANAFSLAQPQPTFGQPSFGQSPQIPSAFAQPAFGQTGFGQTPSFGRVEPTFGQIGLGQPQPIFGQTVVAVSLVLQVQEVVAVLAVHQLLQHLLTVNQPCHRIQHGKCVNESFINVYNLCEK
ncbi:nucleoporin NUP42 [Rhizophagus clarus]|uniref:Nucleoporin NUP42 n=1 Tax=Rhizophagus clarus TaxID=94130 RepID=A0A8H3L253_9GLOM|nr:nucleoporin NUP42 [Rhizophagus clarus]